jgi:hypothetical protein
MKTKKYVIKLTDEEKEALRRSKVNGPLYHLVKQVLKQKGEEAKDMGGNPL